MASPKLRPDSDMLKAQSRETRSDARLQAHYELERELAGRLLNASRDDRSRVYGEVYGELFARLADHPQHTAARHDGSDRIEEEVQRLTPWLGREKTFLEIGCGDAALAFRVAPHVRTSFGLDVTEALVPQQRPQNFRFLHTEGVTTPLATASVDIAYSNQLMEHLHPDDAAAQLREIARVLVPGGVYYCSTPSRASGPHDISRYFDYEARGFHLKEYDYGQLRALFRSAGFRKVDVLLGRAGGGRRVPYLAARGFEAAVLALPQRLRARLTCNRYVAHLLGIQILGVR